MMESDRELDRLREAFLDGLSEAVPHAGDPSPEAIWKAVQGQLPEEEARAVLDRAIASPSCAQAWLLAREMSSTVDRNVSSEPTLGSRGRLFAVAAIAAGLVVAAAFGAWFSLHAPREPVYRGGANEGESLVPDGTILSRNAVTLRWRAVPEARGYNLRVLNSDFGIVVAADGLTETSFSIPEERLSEIKSREEFLWQVETVFADGARSMSKLFRVTIVASRNGLNREGKHP